MSIDLFAKLSAQKPRASRRASIPRRPSRAAPSTSADEDATVHLDADEDAVPSTARRKRLGPSVSIVGDGEGEEVVSRVVPTPSSRLRPPLATVRANTMDSSARGKERRNDEDDDEDDDDAENDDTSGELMQDAERSHTSVTCSPSEARGEDDRATEPLPRKTNARTTTRTPVAGTKFDEQLKLADATKACLLETVRAIRGQGMDPARVFASLAKTTGAREGSEDGFDALARAIDALSPVVRPVDGKRLSFSAVTPTSAGAACEAARAVACDVSEDVSFGSVGESFEQTADEEVVEEEGTFPTCECGEENCTLVGMHARGGPFSLPAPDVPSRAERDVTESIVETDEEREDEEESIAGTEVDDVETLGAAVDALDLVDAESEDKTAVVDELVIEEARIDDEEERVEEVFEAPVAQIGTHIRFEDSPLVASDVSRSPLVSPDARRPRNRTARRGAILDSDEEDSSEDESSETNEDDDVSAPTVSTRPRRAATRKPSFAFRNAFVDDELSGSEEFEYDEEIHTSDDDFIDDKEDEDDGEYRVEYDSDLENVTPAPRKPMADTDLSKEVAEKLVIDEYSPSNLHTPTPPKELSPTSAVKAFRPPPSHSKALQSALKSVAKKGHEKFNFNRHKESLTTALFEEFNENVFGGALPRDFAITWNNKLLTTAGLTHYKRSSEYGETTYSARIELSTKVLDTIEKLEATLLHEMCHASAWLVDKTAKPPHGPVFKKWAQLAMSVYPETCVSTCHAYTIHQPYKWRCTRDWCQQEYGRHSKSIDITKKGCGACGGKLEYLGKFKKNGDVVQSRAPTAFSLFVKEHFKDTKSKLGASTPHKDVMKHLSQRWKSEADKENVEIIDVSE